MLVSNVVCETSAVLRILWLVNLLRRLLFFGLPILLTLVITFKAYKNIINANEEVKTSIMDALKRMSAVVIIFFIPTIVNIVISFGSQTVKDTYKTCIANATIEKIGYYQEVESKVSKVKDLIYQVKSTPTIENLEKAENAVHELYGVANGSIIEDLEYNLASIRSKVVMSDAEFLCKARGGIFENNECTFKRPSVAGSGGINSSGMVYYSYKTTHDYLVVNTSLNVLDYTKFVKDNRICQDQQNGTIYYDQCLCFAEEQVHALTTSDTSRKSFEIPHKYYNNFVAYSDDDKEKVLNVVYSELISNRPVILHVNGNKAGTSRHYVTVIGFKSAVTSAANFKETDMLLIDSYDCEVEELHEWGTSRFMTTGKKCNKPDYSGYQVYMVK